MNPPECKCGRRTDLKDQHGNYCCSQCRVERWPHIFGPDAHRNLFREPT